MSNPTPSILGKIPPQNIEAEAAVLGAILTNKEAMDKVVDIIVDDDFYRHNHQIIFRAVSRLFEKRSPIDLVTLTNELEGLKQLDEVGGAAYLAELVNAVPSAIHVAHYAEIVKQKAVLRRILSAGQQIAELGYDEEREVAEIMDDAERALFDIGRRQSKDNFMLISDILATSFDRIDRLHREKGVLRGVTSGYKSLDNKLSGFQPSDLIILAARPSMGKTSFALNLALNSAVKAKTPVAFFSLEQSKEQIVDRLICAQAMVDGWKLRTGNLNEDDFPAIGMAMGVLAEAPIFIDDSPMLSVIDIRTRARRLKAEHNLGMIIVDYLQLINGPGGTSSNDNNRVQQVSEISRSLKAIARELDVPLMALSQLSRAVEARDKKIPQLSDLRESGCLTGDAQLILAKTGQLISIEELATRKNQTPIEVLSLSKDLKVVPMKLTKAFSSGQKMVYELVTRSGREIKASGNHPFLTVDGWRPLESLNTKDRIGIPRELKTAETSSTAMDEDELLLLAHLIGDGCILPRQPYHYTSADPKNIKAVEDAAKRLFGITPRTIKQKNWWHVYLPSPYHLTHGRRHPITEWYERLNIERCRSWQKSLPDQIFQISQDQIKFFLHHIWATDGNISWQRHANKSNGAAIYYSSTSKILTQQIQHLLLRLGILSVLRSTLKKGYRRNYQIHIQGMQNQLKFLQQVGCFGLRGDIISELVRELSMVVLNPNIDTVPATIWRNQIQAALNQQRMSWRKLSFALGKSYGGTAIMKNSVGRQRLREIAEATESKSLVQLAESEVFWDEILSITELGIQPVFDATVPGTHNFIANDIIVHNSIEQDADIVMFLYREDYYDRNTERKGITDVLIRKHRNGPIGEVELHFRADQGRFFDIERKTKKE